MPEGMFERLDRLVSLGRWLIGGMATLIASTFALGMTWRDTQVRIERLESRVDQIQRDREVSLAEWRMWRESVVSELSGIKAELRRIR